MQSQALEAFPLNGERSVLPQNQNLNPILRRGMQGHSIMTKINRKLIAFLTLCLAGPLDLQAQVTDLTSFNGANGRNSYSGVILSQDGTTFYGTTYYGGAAGYGEVFSVPVGGGTPTVLTSFNNSNGANPQAGLLQIGNTLYGTTSIGGANGDGVVFSLPVGGGATTVLANFNGTNGQAPMAGLVVSGNTLYGTTFGGGANGHGEVFSLPIGGGTPTVLASFNGSNGQAPSDGRLLLSGNTLYGTTLGGGASGSGAVYSVPIGGGGATLLGSFNGANGEEPTTGLVLSGNTLYGATMNGGAGNDGVVFSLPVNGGTPTVLASFNGTNGRILAAGLVLSGDGSTLYGGSDYGGDNDIGVIYSVPVQGGTPTVLASFTGANGSEPVGEFVLDGNILYGTTVAAGASQVGGDTFSGDGVVFSVPVPAPEPGCAGLLLAGSLAMLVRRRRDQSIS